jgi:hypothetical protein
VKHPSAKKINLGGKRKELKKLSRRMLSLEGEI